MLDQTANDSFNDSPDEVRTWCNAETAAFISGYLLASVEPHLRWLWSIRSRKRVYRALRWWIELGTVHDLCAAAEQVAEHVPEKPMSLSICRTAGGLRTGAELLVPLILSGGVRAVKGDEAIDRLLGVLSSLRTELARSLAGGSLDAWHQAGAGLSLGGSGPVDPGRLQELAAATPELIGQALRRLLQQHQQRRQQRDEDDYFDYQPLDVTAADAYHSVIQEIEHRPHPSLRLQIWSDRVIEIGRAHV